MQEKDIFLSMILFPILSQSVSQSVSQRASQPASSQLVSKEKVSLFRHVQRKNNVNVARKFGNYRLHIAGIT